MSAQHAAAKLQNLNLYQPQRAARDGRPQRWQMLLGVALLVLAVAADGVWSYWRLARMQEQAAAAAQAAGQAEEALAEAQRSFREPQPDPRLPQRLAALEASNRQLLQLTEHLQMLLRERSIGFSPALDALAERHVRGVWLNTIRIEQGGGQLLLEGFGQTPALLPGYLDSLGRSPAFAGRQFARFDLDRDEAGTLRFRLSSSATDDDEEQQR